ncbi:MAG: hypothetical protein KC503_22850 [Myxococcales bacterium]|nr:hypothetical protein [Myxococcales bacterium]
MKILTAVTLLLATLGGAAEARSVALVDGLQPGEKLAHAVLRAALGPSKRAAVVLYTRAGKRGFFGHVWANNKRYRLPMPDKDIATSMQWKVEAVAFVNVDRDRAKEIVVMTTYMIGAGPQGAIPQPYNYLFDYDAKRGRFVRLAKREKKIRHLRTAKKVRAALYGKKR